MAGKTNFYVVAMRCPAGVMFKRTEAVPVSVNLPNGCKVRLTIQSRWQPRADGPPVVQGLHVDGKGEAATIEEAMTQFTETARGFSAIVAFVANGPVGNLEPELAYQDDPDAVERQFFQQYLPAEPLLVYRRRAVPAAVVDAMIRLLGPHPEKDRLMRAIGHYHHALQNFDFGSEIFALAHLYMAVETLTPVIKRRLFAKHKVDADGLARLWDIEKNDLDPQIRLREVFGGDETTYSTAKETSDAYEHGYQSFDVVRSGASSTRDLLAEYVRGCLLDLVGLSEKETQLITSPPYDKPFGMRAVKYLRGRLIGAGNLAAEDQLYPFFDWKTKEIAREVGPSEIKLSYRETFKARFGDEIQFRRESYQVWGGPPEAKSEEPQIATTSANHGS